MILAQSFPNGTDVVTIYEVPKGRTARVDRIYVCNSTGSAANASLFVDAESREDQNFDADTAIVYANAVAANDSLDMDCGWTLQAGGTIGAKTGTSEALTFTVFGELL